MRKRRLPDMLILVVHRGSDDLSAVFDRRQGCCKEERAASAQKKDQAEFITEVQPLEAVLAKLEPSCLPRYFSMGMMVLMVCQGAE
jgi:hypothetical protein